MIPQCANVIALGNAFRQIQHTAVAFPDAVVATHRNIAEFGDFLVRATRVLPRFHKRTVVEINGQLFIGAFHDFHFKNQLCRL